MSDEVDIEHQYRKNLMIISSVLLIYSIAGGEINGEINLSGVGVRFKNSGYLEWIGLIVMYFLWWRHLLVSKDIRDRMNSQVFIHLKLSALSIKRIFGEFIPGVLISVNPKGCSLTPDSPYEIPVELGSGNFVLADLRVTKIMPIQVSFGSAVAGAVKALNDDFHYSRMSEYRMRRCLTKFIVAIDYWRCFVSCALKYPSFGDGVLPSLIVISSTIAFFVNKL